MIIQQQNKLKCIAVKMLDDHWKFLLEKYKIKTENKYQQGYAF